jgi:hypothetical protein
MPISGAHPFNDQVSWRRRSLPWNRTNFDPEGRKNYV